jgi:hypothetical protein
VSLARIYEILQKEGFKTYDMLDPSAGGYRAAKPVGVLSDGKYFKTEDNSSIHIQYHIPNETEELRKIDTKASNMLSPKETREYRNKGTDRISIEKTQKLHQIEPILMKYGYDYEMVSDRRWGLRLEIRRKID